MKPCEAISYEMLKHASSVCFPLFVMVIGPGPEVIKLFFMLNSVEHEIFPAHKC